MRRILLLGALLAGAAAISAVALVRASAPGPEIASATPSVAGQAGMCPWREPARDIAAFFPGADAYRTDILVLSRLRRSILARLGPGASIESNVLYVYRVTEHGRMRGAVVVRRGAGEYGAVEVVAALDTNRTTKGIRIQREREPAVTRRVLTSGAWLTAFRGKTADSAFRPGIDLPRVPATAQATADAVAAAVRSVLVELEVAETSGAGHLHEESH